MIGELMAKCCAKNAMKSMKIPPGIVLYDVAWEMAVMEVVNKIETKNRERNESTY